MIGCGSDQLGLARAAALDELLLGPAARDDDPLAGGRCLCTGADARHGFGQRAQADPTRLGLEGEASADGVDMRIDQAGDDGAAGKIDDARVRPGEPSHLGIDADGDNMRAAHRQRLRDSSRLIERDDLAARQDQVGLICGRRSASGEQRRGE